jgi:type I restriction-modification system DNA methylase subunit
MTAAELIEKWSNAGGSESSNAIAFTNDLCDFLGVDHPEPFKPVDVDNAYVFEKPVRGRNGNLKFIDVYKRNHFVLENKQGVDNRVGETALSATRQAQLKAGKTGHGKRGSKTWDTAMEKARKQAENYARLLHGHEISGGRPPFNMVADVGHSIAVYADWSSHAAHYQPFPDPNNYRIILEDLKNEEVRERLYAIWSDPQSLNPARNSARVTKEIADYLAQLAKSLEGKHDTEIVAGFLMRCLFTMFAEDVKLIDENAFTKLLKKCTNDPELFVPFANELWSKMDTGGISTAIGQKIRHFNGGLFADNTALPLNQDQIQLLVDAAEADWREVEPAIFGTLLERALNPKERHKLGAHYTPRAYVERLVQPTIMEPLRREWEGHLAAAVVLLREEEELIRQNEVAEIKARIDLAKGELLKAGKRENSDKKRRDAIAELMKFQGRLANLRVLDPACGSGNFLYVTLELLKRLEGEVLNVIQSIGQGQVKIDLSGATITPENMLGIELNPRAAKIAELVLWIGYLQWHLRSTGSLNDLGSPILRDYHNIENRDAVLEWDRVEDVLDADGQPLTRWDGETTKLDPVTGNDVPDDTARTQVQRIVGGKATTWPKADFIIGNPPFLGKGEKMRLALGDEYIEALRSTYKKVPGSADFVMYWWHKSALLLQSEKVNRFGFITTNSIWQTFNRRVMANFLEAKKAVSIKFTVADHPWVDSGDGAAVRIAMTVAEAGESEGTKLTVIEEEVNYDEDHITVTLKEENGKIQQDLTIGANVAGAVALEYSSKVHSFGMMIRGSGFILEESKAKSLIANSPGDLSQVVKPYRNGKDITQHSRESYIIDLYGLEPQEVQARYPEIYQHVVDHVKPERDSSRDKGFREKWWLFGRTRPMLRDAMVGLKRYIVTPETAKHRFFVFLDSVVVPDHMLISIAVDDGYSLGVLSSRFHVVWAFAAGGRLGYGNDSRYNKTKCLDTYPFPVSTDNQKQKIRNLAERLDAHRKRQQSLHPKLTMTGMYNVLEKERADDVLTDKERKIHQDGLVGILRELHDELDAAVAEAYGWPVDLPEADILQRLVDLNAERAAEEARGLVRWLRPEYQAPNEAPAAVQSKMDLGEATPVVITEKRKWNKDLDLVTKTILLRDLLSSTDGVLTLPAIATAFKPKLRKAQLIEVEGMIGVLVALGQGEVVDGVGWRGV